MGLRTPESNQPRKRPAGGSGQSKPDHPPSGGSGISPRPQRACDCCCHTERREPPPDRSWLEFEKVRP